MHPIVLNLNDVDLVGSTSRPRGFRAWNAELIAGQVGTGSTDSTDPLAASFNGPGGMLPEQGNFDQDTCAYVLICDNKNALIRRYDLGSGEVDTVLDLTDSTEAGGSPLDLTTNSPELRLPGLCTLHWCSEDSLYVITGCDDARGTGGTATGHVWRWAGPGNNAVNIANNINNQPRCGVVIDDDFWFLCQSTAAAPTARADLMSVDDIANASSVTTSGGGRGSVYSGSAGYFWAAAYDADDGGGDGSWYQNEAQSLTDPQICFPVAPGSYDVVVFDKGAATSTGQTLPYSSNRSFGVWNDGTDFRLVCGGGLSDGSGQSLVFTLTPDDDAGGTVNPSGLAFVPTDFSTNATNGAILIDGSSGNDAMPTSFLESNHSPLVWDNGEVWFCSGGKWESAPDSTKFHGIWRAFASWWAS